MNEKVSPFSAASAGEIDRLSRFLAEPGSDCELCSSPGGSVLWEDGFCRVIQVDDPDYPGFCRVVLRTHTREMSDLPASDRNRLMAVVFAVEAAVRELYRPDKINLASFGNVVPHLHWHVIPRWQDDRHFPQPVWGTAQRVARPTRPAVPARALAAAVSAHLADLPERGG